MDLDHKRQTPNKKTSQWDTDSQEQIRLGMNQKMNLKKAIQVAKQIHDEIEKGTEIARAAYHESSGEIHDGELS